MQDSRAAERKPICAAGKYERSEACVSVPWWTGLRMEVAHRSRWEGRRGGRHFIFMMDDQIPNGMGLRMTGCVKVSLGP